MSVHVTSWVWKYSESQGYDRLVLLKIADDCDEWGANYYPCTYTRIMKQTRISSTATIKACLDRLRELGELKSEKRREGSIWRIYYSLPKYQQLVHSQEAGLQGVKSEPQMQTSPSGTKSDSKPPPSTSTNANVIRYKPLTTKKKTSKTTAKNNSQPSGGTRLPTTTPQRIKELDAIKTVESTRTNSDFVDRIKKPRGTTKDIDFAALQQAKDKALKQLEEEKPKRKKAADG